MDKSVTYRCSCCEVPCEVTYCTMHDYDDATGEYEEGMFINIHFLCREAKFIRVKFGTQ